jgi:hypothetical protein
MFSASGYLSPYLTWLFGRVRQMTLPRSMELQWQREVIEKWLNTPSIPFGARTGLLEILKEVKEEMGRLEAARSHSYKRTKRQPS